nr:2-hydroxyacyl-CoA dehydratase family protein [Candidatus Sigynarchaeota archaeon]
MRKQPNIAPLEILLEGAIQTSDLIEGSIPSHELRVMRIFMKCMKSVMEDIVTRAKAGKPILGHHFAFPAELFTVYDVVPVCFEALSYITAALFTEGSEPYYDLANAFGHPYHSCTSQKGVLGMLLKENFMDVDVIAIPSAPCDNTVASYQFFSEIKKIPTIVADMPYYHDERGYNYYTNELINMTRELGAFLKQEPNYDNLRNAIEYSTRSIEYLSEINDLRAVTPCPVESIFNPIGSAVQNFFAGRPEKEIFYREVRDLAKERVKRNQGVVPEEKIRSYWPYMSVFFDVSFSEWMERELGMVAVSDLFNYFFFDPILNPREMETEKIYRGLAMQSMDYPMVRQSERFLDTFLEDTVYLAKKFNSDCAIFSAHIGCKQSAGLYQLIREVLRDEVGIPMLIIEIDIGDKRFTSIESVKKKIVEFTQTLL